MTGWKEWAIAEVVDADEFQTYLQNQVVMVFADSAARSSALSTSVAEGMVSYLEDSSALFFYNGSAWVAAASDGDITGVTAGTALTGGGTTGDVTLNVDLSAVTIPASQLSDVTSTAAELNILDGVTADATELNILDGVTATTAELNFVDGVTSAVQTQLDARVLETNGAVTTAATGSNVVRNITLSTSAPSGGSDGDVWLVYEA